MDKDGSNSISTANISRPIWLLTLQPLSWTSWYYRVVAADSNSFLILPHQNGHAFVMFMATSCSDHVLSEEISLFSIHYFFYFRCEGSAFKSYCPGHRWSQSDLVRLFLKYDYFAKEQRLINFINIIHTQRCVCIKIFNYLNKCKNRVK